MKTENSSPQSDYVTNDHTDDKSHKTSAIKNKFVPNSSFCSPLTEEPQITNDVRRANTFTFMLIGFMKVFIFKFCQLPRRSGH